MYRSRDSCEALETFIESKPVCFLILGKRASGKSTLAEKIAADWNCKRINFQEVFDAGIKHECAVLKSKQQGKEIEEDDDDEKQEEHPMLQFLTSPSTEKLSLFTRMQLKLWRGEAISNDDVVACLQAAIETETVAHYGYVLDDLPWSDPKEALEKIRQWSMQPDIIINIKVDNDDLTDRRTSFKQDIRSGDVYHGLQVSDQLRSEYETVWNRMQEPVLENQEPDEEENEEGQENEKSVPPHPHLQDFAKVDVEKSNLVTRIEDDEENMSIELSKYCEIKKFAVDALNNNHDPMKIITVNGLEPPSKVYSTVKEVLQNLKGRVINGVGIKPIHLIPSTDEDELPDEIDDDQLFRTVAKFSTAGPRFRWQKSQWNRYCPVELVEKCQLIIGSPHYAVEFCGQILDRVF